MVSIIIPHFNRSALLKDSIASVLKQTSKDWELIIVDDESNEKEFDSIKSLADLDTRIKLLKRVSQYKGPSACRNEGVAVSKGEYLVFLDSDDALAPFCIEQRIQVMEENKVLDLGIFLMQEFTNTLGDSNKIYNDKSTMENRINCFLEGNNPWAVTCPIWKKDFFKKTGGFDEHFFYMEDPDLHVRALLEENVQYKTFYEHPADCYYRTSDSAHSSRNFYENSIRYRIKFYIKTGNLISNTPGLCKKYKKSLEKGVIQFFQHLLLYRLKEFPALQREFMEWATKTTFLSKITVLKLQAISAIYESDKLLFQKIHLRGLASKIFLPKL